MPFLYCVVLAFIPWFILGPSFRYVFLRRQFNGVCHSSLTAVAGRSCFSTSPLLVWETSPPTKTLDIQKLVT